MTRTHVAIACLVIAAAAIGGACKNRSNRPGDTLTCTPGEQLSMGCTGTVGSVCEGDPVMDACDGTVLPSACNDDNAIEIDNDFEPGVSNCPLVETTCPTSGRITVGVHGYMGSDFACYWDIVHGGHAADAGGDGG